MPSTRIVVDVPGEQAYDVRVGEGLLAKLGAHLRAVPATAQAERALVVTDEAVDARYRPAVKASLAEAGFRVSCVAVPSGATAWSWPWAAGWWATSPASWPPPTCAA